MARSYKNNGQTLFRRPRTQRSRVIEVAALEELRESEIHIPNRLLNRASLAGAIPTAYDDLNYSTRSRYA